MKIFEFSAWFCACRFFFFLNSCKPILEKKDGKFRKRRIDQDKRLILPQILSVASSRGNHHWASVAILCFLYLVVRNSFINFNRVFCSILLFFLFYAFLNVYIYVCKKALWACHILSVRLCACLLFIQPTKFDGRMIPAVLVSNLIRWYHWPYQFRLTESIPFSPTYFFAYWLSSCWCKYCVLPFMSEL